MAEPLRSLISLAQTEESLTPLLSVCSLRAREALIENKPLETLGNRSPAKTVKITLDTKLLECAHWRQ